MSQVVAYVRVSTNRQDLENQRHAIERFCAARHIEVDAWDQDVMSGTVGVKERNLGQLLETMQDGDTLIVSEVSRISRSITGVMVTLEQCANRGINVMTVKESLTFTNDMLTRAMAALFGIVAEIERSLISARTKEALARKKSEGVVLGRPVGSYKDKHYKLYGKDEKILRLMERKVSIAAIARVLGVNRKTLQNHIERQDLRRQLRYRLVDKMGV